MKRIQLLSQYILYITKVGIYAMPGAIIGIWLVMDVPFINNLVQQGILFEAISTPEGSVNLAHVKWNFLSKTIAIGGQIIGSLPLYLSLFMLSKIFSNYSPGQIFLKDNARHYGRLGLLCFLDALIAKPLSEMLRILGITLSEASQIEEDQRHTI